MKLLSHHDQSDFPCAKTPHLRRRLVVGLFACILSLSAVQTLAQEADTDCQCRAPDGTMRNLGTVECVNIVGNRNLVRCEMSTNTPYWKKIDGVDGCPDA